MTQDAHQDDVVEPAASDDALASVRDLDAVPTHEHVERYEDVERALRARLDGTPDVASSDDRTER